MTETNTERALGQLMGQMDALAKAAETDRRERRAAEASAQASREAVNATLAELATYKAETRRLVTKLSDRVDAMEPIFQWLGRTRGVMLGVFLTVGVLWGVIVSFVTFFKDAVLRLLGWE